MSEQPEFQRRVKLLPWLPSLTPPVYLVLLAVITYLLLISVPLVTGIPLQLAVVGGSILFAALALAIVGVGAIWEIPPFDEVLLAAAMVLTWLMVTEATYWTEISRTLILPGANIAFLMACMFVGKSLSRIVREASMTLPVCLVAGLADVFTVFFGPTGKTLAENPGLVQRLSLAIPEAGSAAGPQGASGLAHVSMIGLGDFIFMSLFMAVAVRFGFRFIRTFWGMLLGACAGIFLTLTGVLGVPAMPLLPYIGAGFIAANARQFQMTRQEWRDFAFGIVLFAILFLSAAIVLRSQ